MRIIGRVTSSKVNPIQLTFLITFVLSTSLQFMFNSDECFQKSQFQLNVNNLTKIT